MIAAIRGDNLEALAQFQLAEGFEGAKIIGNAGKLVYGYGLIGREDDALRTFGELQALAAERTIAPVGWVLAYLGIDDTDQALVWLNAEAERLVASDNQDTARIKSNAYSDPILDQPEFVEVRSRLGFRE